MKYSVKKLVALLMALLMVFGSFPISAFAEGDNDIVRSSGGQSMRAAAEELTIDFNFDSAITSDDMQGVYLVVYQPSAPHSEWGTAPAASIIPVYLTTNQVTIKTLDYLNNAPGGPINYNSSNETSVYLAKYTGEQEPGYYDLQSKLESIGGKPVNISANYTSITVGDGTGDTDTFKNGTVEGANVFVNITGASCLSEDGYYLYVGDPFSDNYSTAKYSGLGLYGFKYEGTGTLYVILKEATFDTVISQNTYDIVKWEGDTFTTDPSGIGNYNVSTEKNENTYTITFEEIDTGNGTVTINFPSSEDVAKSNGYYLMLTKNNSDSTYVIALGGTDNPITDNIKKTWSNGGDG